MDYSDAILVVAKSEISDEVFPFPPEFSTEGLSLGPNPGEVEHRILRILKALDR